MKVTIKEIAKLADVSIARVSKVVNNKDEKISAATRERVLTIIKETGYVANRVASSMVTKRTNTIGLLIPDIANPFFPELARGAEDLANKLGYTLILCNSDNKVEKEDAYLEMLQEKMVDGIEFDGLFCGNDLLALGAMKRLHQNGILVPDQIGVVGFDDINMAQWTSPELTTVNQAIYEIGYKATDLLIKTIQGVKTHQRDYILKTHLIRRGTTR